MLSIINDLMQHHGIFQANVSVKKHGDTIAAVINLVPDPKAIPDESVRGAMLTPIVLIGEDAINATKANDIMSRVRMGITANSYLDSQAVADRLKEAEPKAKSPAPKATAKKVAAPTAAKPEAEIVTPQAPDMDSLFSGDSL